MCGMEEHSGGVRSAHGRVSRVVVVFVHRMEERVAGE